MEKNVGHQLIFFLLPSKRVDTQMDALNSVYFRWEYGLSPDGDFDDLFRDCYLWNSSSRIFGLWTLELLQGVDFDQILHTCCAVYFLPNMNLLRTKKKEMNLIPETIRHITHRIS